ncbi:MAG: hypothetical protein IPF98_16955 [Gemmatimonadetes bacterium]|nr:hypothetical protein [Gemmatimonadota bacterium]
MVEHASAGPAGAARRYCSEATETFDELSVEGGPLVVRHCPFAPVTLTQTNADTVFATLPVSEVVFRRDAQGTVTSFEADNGGAGESRVGSADVAARYLPPRAASVGSGAGCAVATG